MEAFPHSSGFNMGGVRIVADLSASSGIRSPHMTSRSASDSVPVGSCSYTLLLFPLALLLFYVETRRPVVTWQIACMLFRVWISASSMDPGSSNWTIHARQPEHGCVSTLLGCRCALNMCTVQYCM